MKNTKIRQMFKMSPEELQEYLKFKRKGGQIQNRKGKGSYTRKEKYKKLLTNS